MAKRHSYHQEKNNKKWMWYDNPDYKPFQVELSNITKIWEVVWHGSKI